MLGIKFNVETPKCEFSEAGVASMCRHIWKILRQKINETDINIRQRYTWEPNAFNCTFLTLFLTMALARLANERAAAHVHVVGSFSIFFTSRFFFGKFHTQENSIEMAFRKILIAFARSARCRNNENYDK